MKRILGTLAVALCLVFVSHFAGAQEEDSSAPELKPAQKEVKEAKQSQTQPAGNFTIGFGPIGNIFVVDSNPELGPGVGGHVFFDYRWSPQFSTQFGVFVSTEDGKGRTNGDDGILFLGMPTFDLKFYVLSNPSRWDPYGLIGIGFYTTTEGTVSNGSKAFGIGADLGIGTDFYLTEKISFGFATVFRSIGLIDSFSGASNGTALFPVSLMGNLAYHF